MASDRAFNNPLESDDSSSSSIDFELFVTSSSGVKAISLNEPFYDVVHKFSDQTYSIRVDPVLDYIMVSRKIMTTNSKAVFYVGD